MSWDVIVIGAGAAGLMCAAQAGRRGRRVLLLEHSVRPGQKILISGGGRCNFTNLHCRHEHFLSSNPHFAKSALARYRPGDFIQLVEKHGIAYHEKTLGQLFCDESARQIVDLLLSECREGHVTIQTNTRITGVTDDAGFRLTLSDGAVHQTSKLVVATGGLSIPKMGATGFGYELARQFGHRIITPEPGLVPLTWHDRDARHFGSLAGVSTEVVASVGKQHFREKLLFTHRGLSGPAILQISSYWQKNAAIRVDLAPGLPVAETLLARKKSRDRVGAATALSAMLPRRLADAWTTTLPDRPIFSLSDRDLEQLGHEIHQWHVRPYGTEGFEKAEVTRGGVDTMELSSQTMESTLRPGLYFIGEVVDVTGHLGGFNFQWAWASGFCCGQAV